MGLFNRFNWTSGAPSVRQSQSFTAVIAEVTKTLDDALKQTGEPATKPSVAIKPGDTTTSTVDIILTGPHADIIARPIHATIKPFLSDAERSSGSSMHLIAATGSGKNIKDATHALTTLSAALKSPDVERAIGGMTAYCRGIETMMPCKIERGFDLKNGTVTPMIYYMITPQNSRLSVQLFNAAEGIEVYPYNKPWHAPKHRQDFPNGSLIRVSSLIGQRSLETAIESLTPSGPAVAPPAL